MQSPSVQGRSQEEIDAELGDMWQNVQQWETDATTTYESDKSRMTADLASKGQDLNSAQAQGMLSDLDAKYQEQMTGFQDGAHMKAITQGFEDWKSRQAAQHNQANKVDLDRGQETVARKSAYLSTAQKAKADGEELSRAQQSMLRRSEREAAATAKAAAGGELSRQEALAANRAKRSENVTAIKANMNKTAADFGQDLDARSWAKKQFGGLQPEEERAPVARTGPSSADRAGGSRFGAGGANGQGPAWSIARGWNAQD